MAKRVASAGLYVMLPPNQLARYRQCAKERGMKMREFVSTALDRCLPPMRCRVKACGVVAPEGVDWWKFCPGCGTAWPRLAPAQVKEALGIAERSDFDVEDVQVADEGDYVETWKCIAQTVKRSERWCRNMADRPDRLPTYKVGGIVRLDLADLRDWLAKRRQVGHQRRYGGVVR